MSADTKPQSQPFQAEVERLLNMVTNAMYSDREVFLRELISNAADACDRLRYTALQAQELLKDGSDFAITISADKKSQTLIIEDNGIGMNRNDMAKNLGTIARSGTGQFMKKLSGDDKKDVNLIGQFGVGFYASFMVASEVRVISCKAGETKSWEWSSQGKGVFTIKESDEKITRGTKVILKLKKDAHEFSEDMRIRHIVTTYSDHIQIPINMEIDGKSEQLNAASALWMRSASEITDKEYKNFFTTLDFMGTEPLWHMHFQVEGMLEYTGLIYIPSSRPYDLFDPERKPKLKLYCNQVFVSEDSNELLPSWLRFLRGVIDSSDMPLNVSREMLQNNPVLRKIKSAIIKRTIDLLEKKSKDNPEEFHAFWDNFGAVLKEALYEGSEHKDRILKLCRYYSTKGDGYRTLEEYVKDMQKDQKEIFCITAENVEQAKSSPQLEAFIKNDVEVLFLTDPIDDFWLQMQPDFNELPVISITRTTSDPANLAAQETPKSDDEDKTDDDSEKPHQDLIKIFKDTLGDRIQDVRVSKRLTTSAVCLAVDSNGVDLKMNRVMRAHNSMLPEVKPILEINPEHAIMKRIIKAKPEQQQALSHVLLDQAYILEGEMPTNPKEFTERIIELIA